MNAPLSLRRRIFRTIFFLTLCAVLYLALMPNSGRARFKIVPEPMYRWLEATWHDDFGNIVAFGFLAFVTFLIGKPAAASENAGIVAAFHRWFADRNVRLACLLAGVVTIEILQIWIPGRTSSLRDVCSGWSGIFAAWLLAELLDVRVKNGPSAELAKE